MKITKEELIDLITYYIEDNDLDYLHVRASVSHDGKNIKIVVAEDIEFED